MTFSGFESSLHGIKAYDWSIGTSPDGEDIQPFIEFGLVHNDKNNVAGQGNNSVTT